MKYALQTSVEILLKIQILSIATILIVLSTVGAGYTDLTPVSNRTPQVQEAILGVVKLNDLNVANYADITAEHLTGITALYLNNRNITTLKSGDFDGLTSLTDLRMIGNQLSSLPDGIFEGLTGLTRLNIHGNTVDPLPLTVSLVKVSDGKFKAVAPVGAPFEIVMPLNVFFGQITDAATSITIPAGKTESEILSVKRTAGERFSVSVDIGSLPTPPEYHTGYSLMNPSDDPLNFTELGGIEFLPVSKRTEQVRNAIVQVVPGISAAEDITPEHLESITSLIIGNPPSPLLKADPDTSGTTTLQSGDFHGLISLRGLSIIEENLSTLPADVFDGLVSLEVLILSGIFTDLPVDIFDELGSLKTLSLGGNFSSLPSGVFDNQNSLETLILGSLQLNNIQPDIFNELSSLTSLTLLSQLSTLPENIFQNLPKLTKLAVGTKLQTLPSGLFKGLTALTSLNLQGDGNVPLPLMVALEKVNNDQFKAVVQTGAPYDIVLPIIISNGVIKDGHSNLTIPIGSIESETRTVLRAPGTTHDVTVDIDTLPNLPKGHHGYTLVKSTHLPLIYSLLEPSGFVSVSDRTPQVRDAIVAAVPGITSAADVTPAHLAAITTLDLSAQVITSLSEYDFSGMSALRNLFLNDNQLTELPNGIFSGLSTLQKLSLSNNQLTELPNGIFSGLSALHSLALFENQLTQLPAGVFTGLSSLGYLELTDNQLTELPDAIFNGLSSLESLHLSNNALVSLPAGLFNGLSALSILDVSFNQLTELPGGIFSGLSTLTEVDLSDNAVNPLQLTVSLEKVADGQFKVVVPNGAPFDIVLPIGVRNGSISGGASSITIPTGNVESEVLNVTRTPGATIAATVNIGTLPMLPSYHTGYVLVKSGDLPLKVTEGDFADSFAFTITVARINASWVGYHEGRVGGSNPHGSLSRRTFNFKGSTYTVTNLYYSIDSSTGEKELSFVTSPLLPRGFDLYLDSQQFSSSACNDFDGYLWFNRGTNRWYDVDLNWSPGQIVQVRVVETTPVPPAPPTNLQATTNFKEITLTWDRHVNTDPTSVRVEKYELRISDDGGTTWEPDWDYIERSEEDEKKRSSVTIGSQFGSYGVNYTFSNGTEYTFEVRGKGGDGYGDAARISLIMDGITPMYDRTWQVRDAIVAAVPGITSVLDITQEHIATITELDLSNQSITSLTESDFEGLHALTSLNLSQNNIATLPSGIFDKLSNLTTLNISIDSTSLSSNIFDDLTNLTELTIQDGKLTSLPSGIFDNLTNLKKLSLHNNELTSLPSGIFDNLTSLISLTLSNNQLTSLRSNLLNQTPLIDLHLNNNRLSSLPDNFFIGQSFVLNSSLHLQDNLVDPIPLPISLIKVAEGQVKATVHTGAPFDMVLLLTVANGSINGGATSVTISSGSIESEILTVTRTTDTTEAVTVDIGTLPTTLPNNHKGYALVKSRTDLPLTVIDIIVNNPPVFTDGTSTIRTIDENTESGLNIGDPVSATDADRGNTLSYTLSGTDAASFSIDTSTGQLRTKVPLDYETKQTYTVNISVSDGQETATIVVTINIADIDEVMPLDLPTIYWVDWNKNIIQRLNRVNSNIEDILIHGLDDPRSIALDVLKGKIYWTDYGSNKIQRANLDGTNVEDLVTGLGGPLEIALDLANGKMFWTDYRVDKIQRANLDGSNVEDLVTSGKILGPRSIALDVANGKMYWIDLILAKIQRANLDGTNVEDLVKELDTPLGITLDVVNAKMYWTDRGTNKIQRANLNGTNVQDIITKGLDDPSSITLDVANNMMYWTDWGTDKIQRANLDGSNVEDIVTGLGHPSSVALAIPVELLPKPNNVPVFNDGNSTTRSIAENTASGENIGEALSATDADNDTLTYSLSGTDADTFSIDSDTGQLLTEAPLDYETKRIYTVTVFASDGKYEKGSIQVKIIITDVDDEPINNAPVFTDGESATRSIEETTESGVKIGDPVSATDVDNDTLTYSLSGTDAASFDIDSTTGQLRTKTELDYETKNSYQVTVSVSDGNGGSDTIDVNINVTEVEEEDIIDVTNTISI